MRASPEKVRWMCFLVATLVLAEVACYHSVAVVIARVFLRIDRDTGYELLGFQFLRVLPAALIFLGAAIGTLVATVQSSPRRLWTVVGIVLILNLALLIASVDLYYRELPGTQQSDLRHVGGEN